MKTNLFILTFFLWLSSTAQDIWTTSYGGYNYDQPYALCKTADGGTLTAGYTNSSDVFVTGNHGFTDILLLKYDASGQFVWQKCYGGSINEAALDILPISDSQGRIIRNEFIYSLQSEIETASLATGLYFFQMNHKVVRVYVNNNE